MPDEFENEEPKFTYEDFKKLEERVEILERNLDQAWSTLKVSFGVFVLNFFIVLLTIFFPSRLSRYVFLSDEDILRKLVAVIVELSIFTLIQIFIILPFINRTFSRR